MKNQKKITNKNKNKYLILLSAISIGALCTITYFKINDNNSHEEYIAKNDNITKDEIKSIDIINVKDFIGDNKLLGENLNQFVSRGKLLNDDFLYLKRYDSLKNIDLFIVNNNKELKQKITLTSDNFENIELSSFVQMSDGSLILKTEEYSPDTENSVHSLKKYDINGTLGFVKNIDNSHDVLNLYSSNEINNFASLESDANGNIYIVEYNSKGEQIFKYKTKYDYTSNIDVILKKDKTILLSKEDDCYIVELNKAGDELRKINIPYNNIIVSKISQTSDNGYLVNFVKNETDSLKNSESHIVKFNSNGEIEWSNVEKAHSFSKNIFEVEDGYIFLNYDFYLKNSDENNILSLYSVLKIDKNGNKKWMNYFGVDGNSNDDLFTVNGEYMKDKNLVVTGILENSEYKHLINILIDNNGNMTSVNNSTFN